jgi:hypothetical protein
MPMIKAHPAATRVDWGTPLDLTAVPQVKERSRDTSDNEQQSQNFHSAIAQFFLKACDAKAPAATDRPPKWRLQL